MPPLARARPRAARSASRSSAALVGLAVLAGRRTFGIEERFGFNRTTLRRCGSPTSPRASPSALVLGLPLAVARAVADAQRRARCGGCRRGSRGSAFQLLVLRALPDGHRAAVQQVLAAARPAPHASASRRCSRAAASARQGPVRDGRLEALGPRQRVLHRLRPRQAHRVLRHAARRGSRRTRSRRCSRTSSAISSCVTWSSASCWSALLSLALLALLAWLADAPWFYAGLGIPERDVAAAMARPGVALALFMLALPVFTFALAPLSAAYSRRHEFEADAVRRRARIGARTRRGAGQAVRGQCVDADAGSAAFGVLRFASACRHTRRAPAIAGDGRVADARRAHHRHRRAARGRGERRGAARRTVPPTATRSTAARWSTGIATAATCGSSAMPIGSTRATTGASARRRSLRAQVAYCNTQLGTGYFPDEEEHVAAWLNQRYYGSSHEASDPLPTSIAELAAMHCEAGAPRLTTGRSRGSDARARRAGRAAAYASRRCSRSPISTRRSAS